MQGGEWVRLSVPAAPGVASAKWWAVPPGGRFRIVVRKRSRGLRISSAPFLFWR